MQQEGRREKVGWNLNVTKIVELHRLDTQSHKLWKNIHCLCDVAIIHVQEMLTFKTAVMMPVPSKKNGLKEINFH